MHKDSTLGFHAPFIQVEKGIYDEKTVNVAYDAAMRVISAFLRLSDDMRFDKSLLSEMLSQGAAHTFQIDTVDDAGRWNIQLSGYRFDAKRKITDELLARACDNNYAWWGKERNIITRGSRQGVVDNSAISIARQGVNKTKFVNVKTDRIEYAGGKEWSQTDYYEADHPLSMGYGPEGALECSIAIYSHSSRDRELHNVRLGFRYEGEKIEWLVRQDVPPWHFADPRTRLRDLPKGDASDE